MRKMHRASAMTAVLAVATAGILTGGTGIASADQWDSCDLRVKLDELKQWDTNDEYNIIVWKDDVYESADLNGVEFENSANFKECDGYGMYDYHWVVFKSGEFTRKGDGGYRNWAFYGNFDRPDDNSVVFNER